MTEMTVPDDLLTLFHQMRSLLEEVLAADTGIAASSFGILYLTRDQLERIRGALVAGAGLPILASPQAAEAILADSE